jgi:alkylated DNA repair dioxygenase AlkB
MNSLASRYLPTRIHIPEALDLEDVAWLEKARFPSDKTPDFEELWQLHPQDRPTAVIYGKEVQVQRWHQSYLRDYRFSGKVAKAAPLPDLLRKVKRHIDLLGYGPFNEILVNWYGDGNDYIGPHQDDERELVRGAPIVTLTFCQEKDEEGNQLLPRKFRIRSKEKKILLDVETSNKRILVMCGAFQRHFYHEVPKVTAKGGSTVGRRVSITFRQFKE